VKALAPQLTIVIPAYKEARYLGGTLDALHGYLAGKGWLRTTEVIVVTADAPDGTADLARAALQKFPRALHLEPGPKVGKGRDVRCGMLAATGDLVLFMDADMATPLHHIERFVTRLRDDADVVIGVRNLRSIHADFMRSASSQLANRLVQLLLLPGVRDTQCGFKGFRRAVVREVFAPLLTTGWGFDFEVLGRVRLGGHQIVELAVPDWHDPKGDEGLVGEVPWQASLRTLRELLIVWNRLEGPIARMDRRRRGVTVQPLPVVQVVSPVGAKLR
jgi:dolichyl-phosphate beta-glucosyltransferase